MNKQECSIEKMIGYFIEANRKITEIKDKTVTNYVAVVVTLLNTVPQEIICNKINTLLIDKYFKLPEEKYRKIQSDFVVNYAAKVFADLINYYNKNFTEEDIIYKTKLIIDKFPNEDMIFKETKDLIKLD